MKKIKVLYNKGTIEKRVKEIAQELNKSDYSYIMDIYKSREKQEDYKKIWLYAKTIVTLSIMIIIHKKLFVNAK